MDEILYLHDESLARFGGIAGIGEPGLVESALGSAQNTFWYGHGTVYDVAAAYAFHIAESQAFNDGNKRTGVAAAIMFLKENGIRLPQDDGSLYAARLMSQTRSWIKRAWPVFSVAWPSNELRHDNRRTQS